MTETYARSNPAIKDLNIQSPKHITALHAFPIVFVFDLQRLNCQSAPIFHSFDSLDEKVKCVVLSS